MGLILPAQLQHNGSVAKRAEQDEVWRTVPAGRNCQEVTVVRWKSELLRVAECSSGNLASSQDTSSQHSSRSGSTHWLCSPRVLDVRKLKRKIKKQLMLRNWTVGGKSDLLAERGHAGGLASQCSEVYLFGRRKCHMVCRIVAFANARSDKEEAEMWVSGSANHGREKR